MAKIKRIVNSVLLWFSISIIAVMTVLVTYQVVTRYVFNRPSAVSEVPARYLFVWFTMFGGAYVFGKREHMNIALLLTTYVPPISIWLPAVFGIMK
jgi:TRAP-type C4-dicarboxylate transport system permease small subunit